MSKRFGFSLNSFLRKVNVIHFLFDLEDNGNTLPPDIVLDRLDFISETMENIDHNLGYPLRFLPAQTVVEIPTNNSWSEYCVSYFNISQSQTRVMLSLFRLDVLDY